jgi:hypothetical protein
VPVVLKGAVKRVDRSDSPPHALEGEPVLEDWWSLRGCPVVAFMFHSSSSSLASRSSSSSALRGIDSESLPLLPDTLFCLTASRLGDEEVDVEVAFLLVLLACACSTPALALSSVCSSDCFTLRRLSMSLLMPSFGWSVFFDF